MKTRESWLQNGIFIYKTGLSVTKQDFHLQNRILELQTGLSPCYLPSEPGFARFGCRVFKNCFENDLEMFQKWHVVAKGMDKRPYASPISCRTSIKHFTMKSISSRVWLAHTWVRIRAFPLGTTGKEKATT